jgi:excisionase family DNA binding protein
MELVGVQDAADLLGVSPSTIRRLFDQGKLGGKRVPGGRRRILRSDVEKLKRDSHQPSPYDDGITFD